MEQSLLPNSIKDVNNLALEKCMLKALDIDITKFMVNPVENASDDLLKELAAENHIEGFEGWILANSKEDKQNLVKNSLSMHAKKGSVSSIKEALNNFNIDCEIEEFWEYGGRPSHFRLSVDTDKNNLNEDFNTILEGVIDCYKPKTRKIDSINLSLSENAAAYVQVGLIESIDSIYDCTGEI